jgi:hypothetical protein
VDDPCEPPMANAAKPVLVAHVYEPLAYTNQPMQVQGVEKIG